MPSPNPITDAELAEVKRLHAAATPGEWRAEQEAEFDEDGYSGEIENHLVVGPIYTQIYNGDEIPNVRDVVCAVGLSAHARHGANKKAIIALHNAFGPTLARLEAAERERDELREESAYIKQQLEWVEENGDTYTKESLLDFIRRTIHAIGHTAVIKEALAARDAQQRREGAIEALEGIAKDHGVDGGKAYIAKVVYREFPDLLHMSVGVVDAADLMQAAKRLREGGE